MPFEIESHFYEMAIILAIATALGFFGQKLRQPLLIKFMVIGFVIALAVGMEWPLGFREIRIKSNSAHAGCTLLEIPLPTNGGVSILAVSRGGRVHYEPGPDFRVFPSDRLVLMGPPETLAETEAVLNQASEDEGDQLAQRFEATEVLVPPGAAEIGKSLAELKFRDSYGVTVVGVARNTERIFPGPEEVLQARDVLVVIGLSDAVQRFKQQPWL